MISAQQLIKNFMLWERTTKTNNTSLVCACWNEGIAPWVELSRWKFLAQAQENCQNACDNKKIQLVLFEFY